MEISTSTGTNRFPAHCYVYNFSGTSMYEMCVLAHRVLRAE